MTPSSAKVIVVDVRHGTCVKTFDMVSAKPSDATSAKATHVSSTKAANLASAAAHTATAAASSLCTRSKKALSEHCACQNCYNSSFHDFLHLDGRIFRHRTLSGV